MEKPFDTDASVPFDDAQPVALSVAQNPNMPDAPAMGEDFIPNPNRKRPPRKPAPPPPPRMRYENVEFRTHKDQRAVEKKRNARTVELAKQIYGTRKAEVDRFEKASSMFNGSTIEQRANPTPELAEAMVVMERGRPMTKARAVEQARKEVAGQERTNVTLIEG